MSSRSVVHTARDIVPDDPINMLFLLALELTQSPPQSFWLNDAAKENILFMLVTPDTSHFEMSLLNDVALSNIKVMSVTLETSQVEMSALNDVALRTVLSHCR